VGYFPAAQHARPFRKPPPKHDVPRDEPFLSVFAYLQQRVEKFWNIQQFKLEALPSLP
jgi:hypothetical protein